MQQKRQKFTLFEVSLELQLQADFEETVAQLKEQGTTEALVRIAERLCVYTKRTHVKELVFALAASVFVAFKWMDRLSLGMFFLCMMALFGIFYGPMRSSLNPSRDVLLRAAIALLDDLTRADVPALLTLLQALEQGRGDAKNQEQRIRKVAFQLLARHLPRTPQSELETLSAANRRYLVRELKRLAPRAPNTFNIELAIQFLLVLAELNQPGAENRAQYLLAISDDERLREAAQEYLNRRGVQ
jgi:hypothetical protein